MFNASTRACEDGWVGGAYEKMSIRLKDWLRTAEPDKVRSLPPKPMNSFVELFVAQKYYPIQSREQRLGRHLLCLTRAPERHLRFPKSW